MSKNLLSRLERIEERLESASGKNDHGGILMIYRHPGELVEDATTRAVRQDWVKALSSKQRAALVPVVLDHADASA